MLNEGEAAGDRDQQVKGNEQPERLRTLRPVGDQLQPGDRQQAERRQQSSDCRHLGRTLCPGPSDRSRSQPRHLLEGVDLRPEADNERRKEQKADPPDDPDADRREVAHRFLRSGEGCSQQHAEHK